MIFLVQCPHDTVEILQVDCSDFVFASSEMCTWNRCYSLFSFSDRGILRNGNGPDGYSDHGARCFCSWKRYRLSLALDRSKLGWDGLNCTVCSLFVDWSLYVCLLVDVFASFSSLHCLWSSLCCFLSLICLAWSCFIAGVLDFFQAGLFLITFIPENWTHSACELHY